MENNKSLIPVNTSIERIEKQITIGDKILNNQIENLFNEAFYLMNSKNLKRNSQNFYSELLKDSDSFLFSDFKFDAEIKDDYIKAIEILDKVLSQKPNFKFAYYFRGIAFSEIFKYEESIANYTKTIELDNNFKFAFGKRAWSYYWKGELLFAIDDCTKAIDLALFNTEMLDYECYLEFLIGLYILRGDSKEKYYTVGELDELDLFNSYQDVIKDFDKVIELSKKNTTKFREDLVWCYEKNANIKSFINDFSGALRDLTEKIEIENHSGHYYSYFLRCKAKEMLGDLIGSEEDYEKYLELINEEKQKGTIFN